MEQKTREQLEAMSLGDIRKLCYQARREGAEPFANYTYHKDGQTVDGSKAIAFSPKDVLIEKLLESFGPVHPACPVCGKPMVPDSGWRPVENAKWKPAYKQWFDEAGGITICRDCYLNETPPPWQGEVLPEPKPEPTPAPEPEPMPQPAPEDPDPVAAALAALQEAISNRPAASIDPEEIRAIVRTETARALEGFTAPLRIEVKKAETGEIRDMGVQHNVFPKVLALAAARQNICLVGPAASGKTQIAANVADALGLPHYAISVGLQTSKTDLFGFIDGYGNYQETLFRKAYETGGVFLLDEMDAGNPNVLVMLNAATANGQAGFPDGKMVPKHEDFVLIAAANTYGRGSDGQYVGRLQMDAATRNRFAFVTMKTDENLETAIAPDSAWCRRVQKIRAVANTLKEKLIVSMRATINGGKLAKAFPDQFTTSDLEEMFIFQGVSEEVKTRILENI